ncbi:MAG: DUF1573 domain-containing protein [Planctomycetales bacterium]|nr:DUF1573 domain-containing protein [Planctomycetales bacterium]
MFRVVFTILVAALLGWSMGKVHSMIATTGWEERFNLSRETLAEVRGELTNAEIVQQSSQGTPVVEVVGGTEFNFGTMQHGEERSHEFLLRNVGNGPLNLEMGTSTCKCTVGNLDKSVLQPGEETNVKLTWKAQTIMPDFGQSATIITTDPTRTEVKLVVRGKVADSFVIEPRELELGDVSDSEGAERTFHVFNYMDQNRVLRDFLWIDENTRDFIEIESHKIDLDKAQFPEHATAREAFEVTLRIKPKIRTGPLSSRIRFSTDLYEDIGELEVPVKFRVSGDVTLVGGPSFDVKRNRIDLGTVSSATGASVNVWLRVKGSNTDSIQPVIDSVYPEQSLQVTIEEPTIRSGTKMFPIRLEIPKGAPEANFPGTSRLAYGKVVIKTNHEFSQEIPIYVRMVVTK